MPARPDQPVSPGEADALAQPVFAGTGYKPFGEFTLSEVAARHRELAAAGGWGPTVRVAAVARAWGELERAMTQAGAARVIDLGPETVRRLAGRLWVLPPGGTLL